MLMCAIGELIFVIWAANEQRDFCFSLFMSVIIIIIIFMQNNNEILFYVSRNFVQGYTEKKCV